MARLDKIEKIKILDQKLGLTTGFTLYELSDIMNVSLTTVKNYIGFKIKKEEGKGIRHGEFWSKEMLEKYPPDENEIIHEEQYGSKKKYRYAIENFSIFNDQISESIVNDTLPFLEILKQMTLSELYDKTCDALLDLIELQHNGKYKKEVEKIRNMEVIIDVGINDISNKETNELMFNKYFSQIKQSIIEEKVLKILYKPFNRTQSTAIIHPYKIRQSQNRWYLIGFLESVIEKNSPFIEDNRIGKINNLALERIKQINVIENKIFLTKKKEELKNRLQKSFGFSLTKPEEEVTLKIKVSNHLKDYILTNPLINLKQRGPDENNIFTYKDVFITAELIKFILSNGDDIEIVSPKKLRLYIKEKIDLMKGIYKDVG